jgi:hypothetical protein
MKQNQRKCENKNGFRMFGEIMASHENILVLPVLSHYVNSSQRLQQVSNNKSTIMSPKCSRQNLWMTASCHLAARFQSTITRRCRLIIIILID